MLNGESMKNGCLFIIILILALTVLPVPGIDSMLPGFWDELSEKTGHMLNHYGFYIPLGDYHFYFWKDLGILVLGIMALSYRKRACVLKRRVDETQRIVVPPEKEAPRREDEAPSIGAYFNTYMAAAERGEFDHYVDVPSDEALEKVRYALCMSDDVQFVYRDLDGQVTRRTVHPIEIFHRDGHSYLRGWCRLRGDERTFRVDRMSI